MPDVVRILFLADTHLGFDLPVRPRIERRRRGHDFLANYTTALRPALAGEVDLVVHGGDVFNRSRPVPSRPIRRSSRCRVSRTEAYLSSSSPAITSAADCHTFASRSILGFTSS